MKSKSKNPVSRLLTEKARFEFIATPVKSTFFKPELKKFEDLLKSLPRERANELAIWTINLFQIKHIKEPFPASIIQSMAAEILTDDIESQLNQCKSLSILKKIAAWMDLCDTVGAVLSKTPNK